MGVDRDEKLRQEAAEAQAKADRQRELDRRAIQAELQKTQESVIQHGPVSE